MGRVSELLHKALVPLAGRAVLSHLIELAPRSAKIVVCVGCRADQIREYVALAHPQLNVTFVDVADWDQPHGGPGASLLAAKDVIDGDLIFTSCDTLWQQDQTLWQTDHSWAGVAPIPAGTPHARWCRVGLSWDGTVEGVYEKNSDGDWQEFGDKAVDYKWATSVVDRIEETGFIKNPDAEADAKPAKRSYYGDLDEKTDEKGQRYAQLPRLDPYDFYFIYNPDRYYR